MPPRSPSQKSLIKESSSSSKRRADLVTFTEPNSEDYDATQDSYPGADLPKTRKKSAGPSHNSTPRLKRTPSKHSLGNQSRGSQRAYITEFSDDDEDESDFDRETVKSVDILDDDESSFDDNSLPPPDDAVDIDNPEGYDTDLEIDGAEFLNNGEKVEYDPTGVKDYIRECNKLGVLAVSYFQRHIQDQHFIMRHHGLGPLGAKAISKPLEARKNIMQIFNFYKGNTLIESLDLEGNDIQGEGCIYLCNILKDNCYISKLNLSENTIGSVGCKAVCQMLTENSTIVEVDLSGNNFKDSDGGSIQQLIQGNHMIHTLNLRHNKFEVEAARHIKDAMIDNSSLRTLDLSWNHFRLKGSYYLAEMIQENYGLKYLNLAMNGLGNEGAASMGKALGNNQCLEEINLSNNRIGDPGALELAKGLQTNETITTFRLGMNPLSASGALPLMIAVVKNDNSQLSLMDLTNIVVTDAFDTMLVEQLRGQKSRELQVIHGGILFKKKQLFNIETDLEVAYESDPMTKLKRFAEKTKLRLVDVFRQFDKDQSMTLSEDEFLLGLEILKRYGFDMTPRDVEILMQRLDRDGDGELDYAEIIEGDLNNRKAKREMQLRKDQGVQTGTQFELSI